MNKLEYAVISEMTDTSARDYILELIRAEEQGLLIKIGCEGCAHNKINGLKAWESSKCNSCARYNYTEYLDHFEAEQALKGSISHDSV